MRRLRLVPLFLFSFAAAESVRNSFDIRDDLHFHIHARATNKDGSQPVYKNPAASIEARVNDLLPRMTLEEKVAQLYVSVPPRQTSHVYTSGFSIQGDMNGWMNFTDPLDDTLAFNQTGLVSEKCSFRSIKVLMSYGRP